MHNWGDEGVDWNGICDAAHYIAHGLARWGRICVYDYKEKYGTVRVYCAFGWWQIHSITHPMDHYNKYPQWLWRLDCDYGTRVAPLLGRLLWPWQRYVYRLFYARAVRKWPHLRAEILSAADYPELLGGL